MLNKSFLTKSRLLESPKDKVTLLDREQKNSHKSAIIWFTGLSGAGKSTIAAETELKLFKMGVQVAIIDGDNIRMGLNKDLTFSDQDRTENIRRVAEVAQLFFNTGSIILCSFISPFAADRKFARSRTPEGRFFEVYIQCSIEECIKRDPKELYKKALGNQISQFTGISSPYEHPINPELTIETEITTAEDASNQIIVMLINAGIIDLP